MKSHQCDRFVYVYYNPQIEFFRQFDDDANYNP